MAAAAGVSIATTSKALNGIRVSPANLAKVLEAAKHLGYVPNEAARTMRGGRTSTIGLVVHIDMNPNTELMAVLHSQISDFEQRGFSVLLSVVSGDSDVNTLLRRLLQRRVDGLVYWNALGGESLEGYRRAGIPVLAVGYRDPTCSWLPLIAVDGADVFDVMYGELKALGHRKVAEVSPGQAFEMHRVAARSHDIYFENRIIGFDPASVTAFIESLRTEQDPPTALFASYATAVQILAACEQLGIRVPGDVSLIGMTDSDGASLLRTPLTALRMDYERLGHQTSQAMFDAMEGKTIDDIIVPDCLTWIKRSSLGPAQWFSPAHVVR